ncbi:MAG: DUF6537 domain-containing protein [Actinomycetota bacterium]
MYGKTAADGSQLFRSWGLLDADAMIEPLRRVLAERISDRLAPIPQPREKVRIPLTVTRTPFFCSGCPHNWGTKVPDGALVGAGTGCHGMTLLMDPERVGEGIGITAMGNEGVQWIGMEPFVDAEHLFQNYGDGTFFHSAQIAMQNCIGAGKDMTFKILYNSTVAMTGGQDSPSGLGITELVSLLQAIGVSRVAITTEDAGRYRTIGLPRDVAVHDRSRIVEVQEELRRVPGVTVLIHDQACAAELRRDRRRGRVETPKKRIMINHRICEGCGDCGDVSNCLSVQPTDTAFGRKTTIDQASCNLDYSCVSGDCPAFLTVVGDGPVETSTAADGPSPDRAVARPTLPDPPIAEVGDSVRIRLAGIGGTGVVTAAQIIGTAAMFDGWRVGGLDQTGLSQKAGPVVSDLILHHNDEWSSNVVGQGEADLILAFDELVAAGDPVLATAGPHSAVIASTTRTPTGRMITDPTIPYPGSATAARLVDAGDGAAHRTIDAGAAAAAVTGSAAQANLLLVGIAVQSGRLPISVHALERAIDLNGVAVERNLAAFEWGRRWVVDPDGAHELAGAMAEDSGPVAPDLPRPLVDRIAAMSLPGPVADRVRLLSDDLRGYQDVAYAMGYLDAVERAAAAEQRVAQEAGDLTETVAINLHKLLAYKDEYEVARLLLDPAVLAAGPIACAPQARSLQPIPRTRASFTPSAPQRLTTTVVSARSRRSTNPGASRSLQTCSRDWT